MAKKKTATAEKVEAPQVAPAQPAVSKGEVIVMSPARHTEQYLSEMIPEGSDFFRSLPGHIKPDIFKRNLFNALMANQNLLEYKPFFLFREVSKAAALGLLLDPLLGEAYIIEAYDYRTKKKQPQLRVGYKGMNKLARQSGNVAGLWCHDVHKNDDIEVDLGFPKIFHHRPNLFGDRGEIIGYVATIAYKDGTFDFEPMSLPECLAIRDRSDAWKAFKSGVIKSTPWGTDESEMCKKTVFRRLMKRQDQSPEMRLAIQIEDEAEFPHLTNHEPVQQLKAPAPPEEGAQKSDEPPTPPTPPTPPAPPEAKSPEPPAEKLTGKALIEFVQARCDNITKEMVDANPGVFDTLWMGVIEPLLKDAFPPDIEEVQGIYNKTVKKFAP